MVARDLDWPEDRPGNIVAVYWEDVESGHAVIEGWRGPRMESEDFVRVRLEPYPCQDLMLNVSGFWICLQGTRWGILHPRGVMMLVGFEGEKPTWGAVGVKPLFGSRDSMLEIHRKLRKMGIRAKLVKFPDEWTPPRIGPKLTE